MRLNTGVKKGKALDKFAVLDVHRWSDYPEDNNAINPQFDDLQHAPDFSGNEGLRKQHIKVVVLDLYAAWLSDPSRYIAYSRSKNDYRGRSRYNRLHISFDIVKTFPFQPNQCLLFVKTYNSWHAVWPMTGNDPTKLRRTLTINIESR